MDRETILTPRNRWTASLAAAAFFAAITLPSIARADDQDVIDYRQHVMSTMGQQMVLINQIVQKQAPADNLLRSPKSSR